MTSANAPSPSLGSSLEADLAYYKAQYEQLEAELQEFQASSRELEAELEKDIEASEKRERQLQEKAEGLGFEVEEWKVRFSVALIRSVTYNLLVVLLLTVLGLDEIQTIQGRGQQRPEHATERDYDPTRHKQDAAAKTPGHRSC